MTDKSYSFTKKFIEGETVSGFWNIAYYGIVTLNSFITIYFLGVYEYGLYQLVLSVASFFASLTNGFISDLVQVDLSRYIKTGRTDLAKRLSIEYALLQIISVVLLALVLIFGSRVIAGYYGQDIGLYIKIAAIALVFQVCTSAFSLFFKSYIYFKALSAPVFGESAKLLVILSLWLWQGIGITQVLIAYVLGSFFTFSFSASFFIRIYRNIFSGVLATKEFLIRDLFKVYGPIKVLRYVSSRIAANLRPWIIKFFIGTEAVGLFMFARNIIALIVRLMPLGTFALLLPYELENKERLSYLFNKMIKYSVMLSFIFAMVSFILPPVAISVFFPKYNSSIPLFLIMVGIIFLYGFYKILRIMLIVFKEQKTLILRSLDESMLAPLVLVILLPIFGVAGAAMEWVLTYLVTTVLFYKSLIKRYPYLSVSFRSFLVFNSEDKLLLRRIFRDGIRFFESKIPRSRL